MIASTTPLGCSPYWNTKGVPLGHLYSKRACL
jgi:hypothetical protein